MEVIIFEVALDCLWYGTKVHIFYVYVNRKVKSDWFFLSDSAQIVDLNYLFQ